MPSREHEDRLGDWGLARDGPGTNVTTTLGASRAHPRWHLVVDEVMMPRAGKSLAISWSPATPLPLHSQ
jgi:hypothetical protein